MTRRIARVLRSIVALALLAPLLAGCGGDGARGDFARTFGGDPEIAGFELSTADNMPFTGGVSADVDARAGASETELHGLVERLSGFVREHEDVGAVITVRADAITVPVFAETESSSAALAAALALAADDRVATVGLAAADGEDRITSAGLRLAEAAGVDAAFALALDAPELLAEAAEDAVPWLSVRDAETAVRIQGRPGPWLETARSTWTTVAGALETTAISAEPERIDLTLADESDVAAATALVDAMPSQTAIPVVFSSPLVALGLNATGTSLRTLFAGLDPADRALVRTSWTDDAEASMRLASIDDAGTLARALATVPAASAFELLTLTVGAADDPTLRVTSAPAELAAAVTAARAVLADPETASLVVSPVGVTLTTAHDASDAELEGRLDALEALAAPGARACAERPDGRSVCASPTR
ncbi:hypothetical protein MUN78_11020 [Leucobacter allii]|uniref:Uncharacterized protein n=1 Tax=Leucobacter allii TaxID=2932247 RepID=A0ABY4FI47_9MICO|nr:hypothetical protein [Leucobacter allii]UOQ56220.1 hypothetical protein MUN78_11020 [Leucobacter allii]